MADGSRTGIGSILTGILSRVGPAIARFPLSAACAAALTIFLVLVAHDAWGWNYRFDFTLPVAGALACSFFWTLSSAVFGEARGMTSLKGGLLGLCGAVVLAGVFYFDREVYLVPYALYAALILLVGLVPFMFRPAKNGAFWLYNHDLWTGAVFAVIAGVLVGAGVSAILGTLEYLFKLDIYDALWETVWIVAVFLVAPLYFLNAVPTRFDVAVDEGSHLDGELTMRMFTTIVKFILVPLLLVYTVILYAYAFKIGVGWELPKGKLGYMVSAFGVVGFATALLAYPVRAHAGGLVAFFWRHWFWLTLLPLALLFFGLVRRITDYGLTLDRYLLLLVGLWLSSVVVLFGLRLVGRDLRIIPGVLASLLAVTSLGPWSLEGLPARSLADELRVLLQAEGSLDASGVLKGRISDTIERDTTSARRMASILTYLRRHKRLDLVKPMFGDDARQLYATGEKNGRADHYKITDAMVRYLALPRNPTTLSGVQRVSFNSSKPLDFAFEGPGQLRGPMILFRASEKNPAGVLKDAAGVLSATLENDRLVLKRGDVLLGAFELRALMTELAKRDTPQDSPLVVEATPGQGTSRLIVTTLYGRITAKDVLELTNINVWIVTSDN